MKKTKVFTIIIITFLMVLSSSKHVYGDELYDEEPSQFFVYLPLIKNGDFEPSLPAALMAPENGSNIDNLVPYFKWNNGYYSDINEVNFKVSDDPTFNPYNEHNFLFDIFFPYEPGEQSIRYSHNLPEGLTLYWQVSFWLDGGDMLDSEVWSFTTPEDGTTLTAPKLLAPEDESTVEDPPVILEWEAVTGAVEYRLLLSAPGSWTAFIFVTDTNYVVSDYFLEEEEEILEWSVATINEYAIGEQSEWWSFKPPSIDN